MIRRFILYVSLSFSLAFAHSGYGIRAIYDLEDNVYVLGGPSDQLFDSASLQKLTSAYVVLKNLGFDYRFKTQLYLTKKPKKIYDGDIYIKFGGDPNLTRQDLIDLLYNLKKQGIETIKGNVYIDNMRYDAEIYSRGMTVNDLKFAFAAPVSPVVINKNIAIYEANPVEATNGFKAVNLKHKQYNYIDLVNETGKEYISKDECNLDLIDSLKGTYKLLGNMNNCPEKMTMQFAIRNPSMLAVTEIKSALQRVGIKFSSKIKFAKTPESLNPSHEIKSTRMQNIASDMLKESDNLIAQLMVKELAAVNDGEPATHEAARYYIESYMKERGFPIDKVTISDGFGGVGNLLSVNYLVKLLKLIYEDKEFYNLYINLLPKAGIDGTLKNIFPEHRGSIIAKSGSGIKILNYAGYGTLKNGHKAAFVFMSNNFLKSERDLVYDEYKEIIDEYFK